MQVLWASLRADQVDPRKLAITAARRLGSAPAVLLGAGKAAAQLAAGVAEVLEIESGFVVTREAAPPLHPRVVQAVAGHPWPDARSEAAGRELLARARAAAAAAAAPPRIVLVWGGGASALAAVPAAGVTLADKLAAGRALAAAGADIAALNRVRRALSALKGGRLGRAARVHVDALVLSDVVGDPLHVIGGGPVSAAPDEEPARVTLERAGVALAPALAAALADNEAAAPRAHELAHVRSELLAGPDSLLGAAADACAQAGVAVLGRRARVTGEAHALARELAAQARALAAAPGAPRAFLAGGEPTLRLPASPGRGGRAQQVALAVALELGAAPPPPGVDLAVLCAASDGSDGPTVDAGGLVDAGTAARAAAAGHDPARALARCDAGSALAAAGDLVTTGPTGNNLCDLYVVIAAESRERPR